MKPTDKFIIQGLGGEKTLKGTVAINGAKNAVLKAMAGAILFDGPVTLENVSTTRHSYLLSILILTMFTHRVKSLPNLVEKLHMMLQKRH